MRGSGLALRKKSSPACDAGISSTPAPPGESAEKLSAWATAPQDSNRWHLQTQTTPPANRSEAPCWLWPWESPLLFQKGLDSPKAQFSPTSKLESPKRNLECDSE